MRKTTPNRYKNSDPIQKASLNESTKKWRLENPEKIKSIRQKTDLKRSIARREKILKESFNMSYQDYLDKLAEQNNLCAICKKEEVVLDRMGDVRRLSVDHDHTTGEVRGLLCCHCNLGIGNFKDNIQFLKDAIDYLEKYSHA